MNIKDLNRYIQVLGQGQFPIGEREQATVELEQAETVMLALRLKTGLSRLAFKERFGRDVVDIYPKAIQQLLEYGLVKLDQQRLCLTEKGLLLANQASMLFLPGEL